MPNLVHYEIQDRVAVLTVDNPPVNALGPGVLEAIEEAVVRALADAGVDAMVLIGAGSTFVAGADINIFKTIKTRDQSIERSEKTHARLKRLEDSAKPLVAAIHGNALGGGFELAMSCHYRVAVADAKVGQPEVNLGIIPGAGGTQRLPRLAGVTFALEMCTDGKPVPAAKALESGIVDEVVKGDLRAGAVAFAAGRKGQIRKTRERNEKLRDRDAGLAACAAARKALAKSARGAKAPYACVEAIEAAVTLDFEAGSRHERELFADCVVSAESRAQVHLFFAEREAAKVPDVPKDTQAKEIRRAAVVGAGTMGGGIAMSYLNAGIPVLLKEVDDQSLQRGLATIRKNYEASVAKGRLSQEQLEKTLALLTPTTSYDGFGEADIVVEAVFENMDLKKATFAEIAKVTRPDAVLASNTSTLDIDELARASDRPQQVIGHHFFSPANVMKLLEIVRGKQTSKETIATSLKLAKRLNKVGVVVGNCFGFVANRLLAYYMRESYLLLEEGASVAQIDKVLTDFGLPVGPYGMQDIAGIDVGARIRQYLKSVGKTRALGPQSEVPDKLYEMGRYGQKTGAGWYRYEPGSRERIADPLIDQLAEEAARRRGVTRRKISDDEILARIMTALANEGAAALDEGYATRASDIDVIYAYGFGFPRHRGGPMFYADTVGLKTVLAQVKEYRERLGDHWKPAPLLERLAAEGRGLLQRRRVRRRVVACVALLAAGAAPALTHAQQKRRPNVILIYADDLGYGDVSSYGATALQTPHIDRLAREGLRFTDAHSAAATCTPSRYALLTGEYAWRKPGTGVLPGDAALVIDPARTTLPKLFQKAGYATGVVGKWHLGLGPKGGPDWNGRIAPGPREVGFGDSFIMAATGDRVPTVYVENRRVASLDRKDPIRVSYVERIGDGPTGRANPELLKMHPSHGHDQTIVNGISRIGYMTGGKAACWKDEDMADVFTARAVAFVEKNRQRPFFLFFALHDPHVPRVPHPRFAGKTGMGPRGDAIAQADGCVGALLDALDRLKLANDTLVLFSSDNGPVVDDGYEDDAVAKLGGHKPAGPLRGGKYSNFEAGTRVPVFVRWPGHVKPGVSSALVSQVDFVASFGAWLGAAPAEPLDGEDVMPALLGASPSGRKTLVEQAGALSLRDGNWKYIEPGKGRAVNPETGTELGNALEPQLYDLTSDPGEAKNVAAAQPERLRQLQETLQRIRKR